MKKEHNARPRAALLIGAAFLATPAFAQDAPASQSVAPPPILVTPAPAPAQPAPVIQIQPAAPVVQSVPEPSTATPAAAARTARTTTPTRQARTVNQPRSAAPDRAPAAAPVAQTPAPVAAASETSAPPPVVQSQPEAAPVEQAATAETSNSTGFPWAWVLGGIALVIAGIAAALMMRRREPGVVEEYREPIMADPVGEAVYVEPVAVAPVVERPVLSPIVEPEVREAQAVAATAEDVSVHEPAEDDLAGVADATAPVARRPWLELGMRPIRAGTNKDDAVVDFELTVGNSGDTAAKDVRISTFMLADASESEIERMMVDHQDDSAVPPVTIEPGEGTRVDAHLAVPKGELGHSFHPVVVAEARYTLPDGRQGRTSAAFKIGCPSEMGMKPLSASRPFVTETVEAELFGTPEHA